MVAIAVHEQDRRHFRQALARPAPVCAKAGAAEWTGQQGQRPGTPEQSTAAIRSFCNLPLLFSTLAVL